MYNSRAKGLKCVVSEMMPVVSPSAVGTSDTAASHSLCYVLSIHIQSAPHVSFVFVRTLTYCPVVTSLPHYSC